MSDSADNPIDSLWQEYGQAIADFDDLSLARWMAQTLGQLEGRVWRFSHPLMGVYRLAAQVAHDRQIWFQRLVSVPRSYLRAECCRAPLLPFLTRDLADTGLVCLHCNNTAVSLEDLQSPIRQRLSAWAEEYEKVHDVAHWDEDRKARIKDYQKVFENAALAAEALLVQAGRDLAPTLLDDYPAVVWEDQDECLDVRPEDIQTWST
ncbi:MAG: hypothetical protein ISQ14_05505 [Verrucomicrobiae bacterium]|nr:hypothetical protein [Verrucomicrobiae bacterium]